MKRFFPVIGFVLLFAVLPLTGKAQCKGFAKKICKLELDPYIHDGNFNAAILTEGEEAELYKTFYSGQQYRVAICASAALPQVEFKIIDVNNTVLYNNKSNDFSPTWDFKPEASQQLKISVKIPSDGNDPEDIKSGCVAIMFGFKMD